MKPQCCSLFVVLATIPLRPKWKLCLKSRIRSSGSLHRRSSGLIQSPAFKRAEGLTAELWLLVLYDDRETRLFNSTITADLCLAGLRDRTEAGNKVGFCMKSGTKNMHSRSKLPRDSYDNILCTLLSNKLGDLTRNPSMPPPPGRPGFHKRRFAERSSILPG